MKNTLYISDLDGTLLNANAELSMHTKATLNRLAENGVNFSIATARTYETVKYILANVKLNTPIVLLNGVLIFDTSKNEYIKKCAFSAGAVVSVVRELNKLGVTGMMYELKNNKLLTYYEDFAPPQILDFIEERTVRYNKLFAKAKFSDVQSDNIIYFTLLDEYDKIAPVKDALSSINDLTSTMYKDIYSENLWYLEIFSSEASKHNATKYLREEYDFERVVSFGDNLNDIPLFDASDYRIAVENAKDEVKAAADFICASNIDDGVATWLSSKLL